MAQLIKRYGYADDLCRLIERDDGEWVKWEGVAPLLEAQAASTICASMPCENHDEGRLCSLGNYQWKCAALPCVISRNAANEKEPK